MTPEIKMPHTSGSRDLQGKVPTSFLQSKRRILLSFGGCFGSHCSEKVLWNASGESAVRGLLPCEQRYGEMRRLGIRVSH